LRAASASALESAARVVDRLRREGSRLLLFGHSGEPVADPAFAERGEGEMGEVGEQALAAMDVEVLERALGQIWPFSGQPVAPEAPERHVGVR
jgi:hypothetical protein